MALTARTTIQTSFGPFGVASHSVSNKQLVSFSYGDMTTGSPIVRFHSACLFGEAFHSLHCDCSQQLTETMRLIAEHGSGVIVYVAYEEGRGIGIENKIRAMELERSEGLDTVEAFKKLGFDPDPREFETKVEVLRDLEISRTVTVFSGNPKKREALEKGGFILKKEIESNPTNLSALATSERKVKKEKLGYSHGE